MFLKLIIGLVGVMDSSMKFMYIFLIASMVLLSGGRYSFYFPICPTLGNDGLPVVDTKADRAAQMTLDYKITYSKEELLELFENTDKDIELEIAKEYISQK